MGSGATLTVKDCSSRRLKAMCTDQLRLALEVMVRRDMADAAVTVGFVDGAFECGTASISPLALSAGMPVSLKTRAVFTESEIDKGEGSPKTQVGQQCRLPATTHRMVVKLWRHGDSRNPVLTQDFAHTFKFVMP